jgi:hypothetical protein
LNTNKFLIWLVIPIVMVVVLDSALAQTSSSSEHDTRVGLDVYAAHSHLMPFKGYQTDMTLTAYLKIKDYRLKPFLRATGTDYKYQIIESTPFATDQRYAAGGGFDFQLFEPLKFRAVFDSIRTELSKSTYLQDSYGLIYNEYIDLSAVEFNGYIESFYIPRVSTKNVDSYIRLQLLKSYYLYRSENLSNALYPFVQFRAKDNDNALFGVTGNNFSAGLGYKFFANTESKINKFSFLIEGHSILNQRKNFNGDWGQALIALQWIIN